MGADGRIGNSGSIVSAADAALAGASVANSGTVSSQGKTKLAATEVTNSGLITSSDELNIRTQNLDNSQTLQAARFDIETGRLNNSGQMVQTGLQNLNIEAGKLNNSGLIGYAAGDRASGDGGKASPAVPAAPTTAAGAGSTQNQSQTAAAPLSLAQGRLNVSDSLTNSGNLTANDGIELSTHNSLANSGKLRLSNLNARGALLDNREGEIITRQAEITAQTLDNRQGSLTATETLTIRNRTTDNRRGTLQSGGGLAAAVQTLDNRNGRLTANRQADIKATAFFNQSGQIDTGRLKAEAARLDNSSGKIRSDEMTELKVSDGLDNPSGLISSAKDIRIHDGNQQTLSINNASGEILAGQHLDIQAKTLAAQGTPAANQNLSLKLKDSFTVEQDIRAGQGLSVSSEGDINNSYTLEGGRFVLLEARNINNTAAGVIQSGSDTRLTAQNLTNRGLINSNGLTLLEAGGTVLNIGTGRVYGDRVGIEAEKLVNREETADGETKAAAIAAREHLAVGAKEIANQESAKLSSEGSLNIGGSLDERHQAQGMAAKLDNNGAEIQSQGDMHIAADVLLNRNGNYRSSHREVPGSRKQVTEYLMENRGYNFNEDHGLTLYTEEDIHHRAGFSSLVLNNGQYHEDYTRTRYTQYDVETVVDSSNPGRILSGGNLTIASADATNDKSHILAAGSLDTPISPIKNLDDETAKSVTMKVGASRDWHYVYYDWKGKKKDKFESRAAPADTELVKTPDFRLNVFKTESYYQGGTAVASAAQAQIGGTAIQPSGSTPAPIKTLNTGTKLPTSGLYAVNPANPSYLVETDPAFANYKQWLGSGYMLNALNLDPSHMHKRLGDGYYEQKLVNEQIARLTGYRRLDGYTDDEEQFKALMEAGITFAREQRLTPGIALSPEQVARLTSDIVWPEEQTLTLIDGSTVTVLAPKVYLTPKAGDLNTHGGLISAGQIQWHSEDNLNNSGTIAGRKIVDLAATDITNSGLIQGGKVQLRGQDVNIEGGTVSADTLLAVEAGRIRVASTTVTGGDTRNGQTQIDRVAGLYVNNASDGLLSLKANESIDFVAATLRNEAAKGQTQIVSDGLTNIGTAKLESHGKQGGLRDKNHRHVTRTSEAGSSIGAAGDILISAQDSLNIRQGYIESNGSLTLSGGNVNISEGRKTLVLDESVYSQSRGVASKKTSLDQYRSRHDEAAGSTIGGKEVTVLAKQDLNVRGSNVVSDGLTVLTAGNNVNITAAQSTYHDTEFHQTKKSGLMGSGGIGFTIGSKKDAADSGSRTQVNHAATVGSLQGDTLISAGQNYRQTGSTVSSPEGNIGITAKQIDIEAAQEHYATDYQRTLEQKGLTVAVNIPVVQAAQNAVAAAKAIGNSTNGRVNAMAAANAAWSGYQSYQSLGSTAQALRSGNLQDTGISASLTYGKQRHEDSSRISGNRAAGSRINAGGKVRLAAAGGGEASNLNITGSDIAGKGGTGLTADNRITLQAAEQHHREQSDNRSSGRNAGIAVSYGQNGLAFGLTGGGNYGKGYGNGEDTTWRHSRIGDANSQTIIQSGGGTTLKGAQVKGKGIALEAQNLTIESLQDSAVYRSKQQNIHGSLTVGYGASANAGYNQSKINADHQSVNEQSGIFAGDDGFQANIKEHTGLKGGIITSSAKAETEGRNRFQTATLSHSDIENHSRYEGDGFGIGISGSVNNGKPAICV
ncbi:hemagglutinin repeat-containing protein [Neisseria dentiae]|uniref:hemagglutinin repeat-containing protein n=1 Tax=Neisseria dentiae TaxID=194197 RepID=UPI0035A0582F